MESEDVLMDRKVANWVVSEHRPVKPNDMLDYFFSQLKMFYGIRGRNSQSSGDG